MLRREQEIRDEAILAAAKEIMLAIRTSPKSRGLDHLDILLVDKDEKEMLVAKMDEIFEKSGGKRASFTRDAKGVMAASAVLLVGVNAPAIGLDCGWCGFESCAAKSKEPEKPCVFPVVDLGIGVGVAAAKLGEKHIDNRMMFSIGMASLGLGWFRPDVTLALGFPLSAGGKNPYFDRG